MNYYHPYPISRQLQLKKSKVFKEICSEKFTDLDHYRKDNEFLTKNNEKLNEMCEELEFSMLEMSYRQPTEEEQLVKVLLIEKSILIIYSSLDFSVGS